MAKQIRCYRVCVVDYPYGYHDIYVIGTKTQVEDYCAEHTNSGLEHYLNMQEYMIVDSKRYQTRPNNYYWYMGLMWKEETIDLRESEDFA